MYEERNAPIELKVIAKYANAWKQTSSLAFRVEAVLRARYDGARAYQEKRGVQFDLSFDEFRQMVTKDHIARIEHELMKGNTATFFYSDQGFVLGWRTKDDMAMGVINANTTHYVTKAVSRKIAGWTKGSKQTDEAKLKISLANTGRVRSAETRAKCSEGRMGIRPDAAARAKMSAAKRGRIVTPEENAKRSASLKKALAAKRAAKTTGDASIESVGKFQ